MSRRQYIILGLCAGVAIATAGIMRVREGSTQAPISLRTTGSGATVSSLARALRPNYPYSIIPGGAYSPAELRAVISHDALVREHYTGFNLNKLRLVTLTQDRYAFVSYRKDNRVFWTHKRLKISQRDILLTDGQNYAKTACGNRISETPMVTSATSDPSDDVLSPLPIEAGHLANLQFAPAPVPVLALGEQDREFSQMLDESQAVSPLLPSTSVSHFDNVLGPLSTGADGGALYRDGTVPVSKILDPEGFGHITGFPAVIKGLPAGGERISMPVPEPPVGIALTAALLLFAVIVRNNVRFKAGKSI